MGIARHFSSSYSEARSKFLEACRSRGLRVESHENRDAAGPDGEALFTDVTRLGADRPNRVLVISSATHGVEGFAGSGCQVAMLHHGLELPDGVGVLLVHAVNPYGFAHERRVTEGNVDLNRNFVDFDRCPVNEGYAELHPPFVPDSYEGDAKAEADQAIQRIIQEKGLGAFQAVVQRGQFTHPDGLFYGGGAPTWSHATLRKIAATELAGVERVAVIDVHTGLGERGHGELILDATDEDEAARARDWFGTVTTPGADSVSGEIEGSSLAAYADVRGAELTRVALEFGTIELMQVFEGVRGDNWLYAKGGGDTASELGRAIKSRIRSAFYGEDDAWKSDVWTRTEQVTHQAIRGLE